MRFLLAALLLVGGCSPALSGDGDVTVEYPKVKKELRPMQTMLRKSGVLERAARQAARAGHPPDDIVVRLKSCTDGTGYITGEGVVELCLQDFVDTRKAIKDEGEKDIRGTMLGVAEGTLLHELGHALIDVRHLPITGREEDAADQFAVWQAIVGLKDPDIVLSDAYEYQIDNDLYEQTDDDEHGSDGQRAVNLYCWLYGSEPKAWKHLVDGDPLTKYRAKQCRDEWKELAYAWETLLAR